MRAVVLSGGGSKGSYEIGVWKALRKMHIKYDIVTGTSIGALNGALMTQNTYFKALYIWNKLSLQYLFEQEPKNDTKIDILNRRAAGAIRKIWSAPASSWPPTPPTS